MNNVKVFDPLDKINLTKSVSDALENAIPVNLSNIQAFNGSGIYAIYYCGSFHAYDLLGIQNKDKINPKIPIYVGKAIASNSRSGNVDKNKSSKSLYNRLSDHAESIKSATNISIDDFVCRFLVVDEIWIPLAESLLITKYMPAWNSIVHGFGNHDPGNGRYNGLIPLWDVAHTGREWASKCKPRKETADEIFVNVRQHIKKMSFNI